MQEFIPVRRILQERMMARPLYRHNPPAPLNPALEVFRAGVQQESTVPGLLHRELIRPCFECAVLVEVLRAMRQG